MKLRQVLLLPKSISEDWRHFMDYTYHLCHTDVARMEIFFEQFRLFYNLKTLQLSCVQQGLLTYMYDNFANTFAYRIQFHLWFLFCYGLFYYLFQDFTVELCQISFAAFMNVGFQLCYRSFYNLFKDWNIKRHDIG